MADVRTCQGGCHCGAVAYEAEVDLSAPVMECNCSHCAKKGFLLTFIPADAFTLKTDRSALSEYRFNKKHIAHLFCATCGVQSFAEGAMPDGSEVRAINVRCLDGVDLGALTVTPVDGKSL